MRMSSTVSLKPRASCPPTQINPRSSRKHPRPNSLAFIVMESTKRRNTTAGHLPGVVTMVIAKIITNTKNITTKVDHLPAVRLAIVVPVITMPVTMVMPYVSMININIKRSPRRRSTIMENISLVLVLAPVLALVLAPALIKLFVSHRLTLTEFKLYVRHLISYTHIKKIYLGEPTK